MNTNRKGYVYILFNQRNGTLYTGVTSFLKRRVYEHKTKIHPESFTAKYSVDKLGYFEEFVSIKEEAIAREKQIKGGSRAAKLALFVVVVCLDCFVVPPRNDAKRRNRQSTIVVCLDCFVVPPRNDAKRRNRQSTAKKVFRYCETKKYYSYFYSVKNLIQYEKTITTFTLNGFGGLLDGTQGRL